MSAYHKSESILKEEARLMDIIVNSEEELTIDEMIEKYANDEYKKMEQKIR